MKQEILQSLDKITTGYSVFEEDQVLTHKQLNTVSDYFDDQTRLTRVKLLGVGIVCGLHVSVTGNSVTLSKGAGVTTDGDLLYFAADTVFDQFKPYDNSNPAYPPFAASIEGKKVFELMPRVAAKVRDPLAIDLRGVKKETGFALDQMVAVLFMEGYVKDEDLCTGTDCDNLGQNFVNTIKLLVMDKALAGALQGGIPDSDRMARTLSDVVANRAVIPTPFTFTNQLVALYRATCQSIHNNLALEFAKLDGNVWTLFAGRFAPNMAAGWRAKLNLLRASFTADGAGIQYYYDFLKDLADTYNDFRQKLLGDTTWCCPDPDSFPKHLLLGNVVPGLDPGENRTEFYPSPLVSRTAEQLNHAAFLAQKLDALIEAFQRPARTNTIRITPSRFEDACLEERAIPYYYPVNAANPIQTRWSYRLHRQNMDASNYSYNADRYNPPPLAGAANPLASQIGRYPFFRIEGHLGQPVATAEAAIEAQAKASNLPFVVQSVHLGTERKRVIKKPGIRYTDFHRFHQILRSDLAFQLDDVKTFSADYARQVNDKLTTAEVADPEQDKNIASQKNQLIGNEVRAATTALKQSYPQYQINSAAWRPSVTNAMTLSAQFKQNLGKITKTEYPTPFDSFIATSHAHWLDWSDIILQHDNEKETDKLLFSNFQAMHTGLEHFAGVIRGGTFVLVYDDTGRVIADFMLPYHCCEVAPEVQPREPDLVRPGFKDGTVLGGIRLTPTVEKLFEGQLTQFTQKVIDPKIEVQSKYFDFFKNSMTTVASVFNSANAGRLTAGADIKFADPLLNAAVNETKAKQEKAQILREKAADPALAEETRAAIAAQAKKAEAELAKSIQATAAHVSDSGMDVSTGSEGFNALMEISAGIGNITDKRTRNSMKTALTALQKKAGNAGLKTMLGGMINL